MESKITSDLILRVLNCLTDAVAGGNFTGDEIEALSAVLVAKCDDEDGRERILSASLAGAQNMKDASGLSGANDRKMAMDGYGGGAVRTMQQIDAAKTRVGLAHMAFDSVDAVYRQALKDRGHDVRPLPHGACKAVYDAHSGKPMAMDGAAQAPDCRADPEPSARHG